MIQMQKLLFWLDKRYNVLLEGKHGIGKTAVILEAFEKANLRYAYFSGSTMDPFIDFVGVPIKIDTADGSYIELIRPKHLADGDIQAIFIDEFNRTHKKIRNAVMELIQFKTINGVPISKDLRVVWAAINPDSADGEGLYDTDRLDPAQKDRFQIQVALPYKCDYEYFAKTYDEVTAKAAIQWWEDLNQPEKDKVSPRRLDYALKVYKDGGDVRDVLPSTSNPSRLINILSVGPAEMKLNSLLGNVDEAKKFFANENNYLYALKTLLGSQKFMGAFLPVLPNEKISALYQGESVVKKHILKDIQSTGKSSKFVRPLMEIASANQNAALANQIRDELDKVGIIAAPTQIQVFYFRNVQENAAATQALLNEKTTQTYHRAKLYKKFASSIPQTMSTAVCQNMLRIADNLCHAMANTISRDMPKMVQITNHVLLCMLKNGEETGTVEKFLQQQKRLRRFRQQVAAPTVVDISRYLKAQANPGAVLRMTA